MKDKLNWGGTLAKDVVDACTITRKVLIGSLAGYILDNILIINDDNGLAVTTIDEESSGIDFPIASLVKRILISTLSDSIDTKIHFLIGKSWFYGEEK